MIVHYSPVSVLFIDHLLSSLLKTPVYTVLLYCMVLYLYYMQEVRTKGAHACTHRVAKNCQIFFWIMRYGSAHKQESKSATRNQLLQKWTSNCNNPNMFEINEQIMNFSLSIFGITRCVKVKRSLWSLKHLWKLTFICMCLSLNDIEVF